MENKKTPVSDEVMDVDHAKLMRVSDHFIPMQFPYESTNIYVRDCYPHYFGILWHDLFVDRKQSVLITGTPGIGKSMFYIYVLEMLKTNLKDTVIVLASFSKLRDMECGIILVPGQEPVMLEEGAKIPEIKNAVYLYDGIPKVVKKRDAKTVIFASPNHEFLKEHSKNPTMRNRFMPLWSESEIFEAAELLKLKLEYEFIQHLMSSERKDCRTKRKQLIQSNLLRI
eukprot:TRINITY_DN9904_c0_g1_i2.p1 TRINITY_DN9904_c0_g1~~TRINITY_DN9904_c0_g1_i2.p1  ORF type:complete len:226 (-),score=50.89 TRINITY_DN9904_c0_g1_i2:951-1628(-)